MSLCTCGSWRRTPFGFVCRQCGKHKPKGRTENSSQPQKPFDAILKEIQEKHQDLKDGPSHHQVLSYKIVNGEILVSSIVYNEEKAKLGKFPKSILTWKY